MPLAQFKKYTRLLSTLLLLLGLSACTQATPSLGISGQPTLVFIYTDN